MLDVTISINFAGMKRIYIWVISIVMGTCFLVLLYLQAGYAQAMVRMRKEQFDESVTRSLDQASHELERNETFRYLESVVDEHEAMLIAQQSEEFFSDSTQTDLDVLIDSTLAATGFRFRHVGKGANSFQSNFFISRYNPWMGASARFQQRVQKAYIYERKILDEVIYRVLYNASEMNFQQRLNPEMLDYCLRNALERNGVKIPFHFVVYSSRGQEVFRCPDFEEKGMEYSYTRPLFRNDPTGSMGSVCIHFPTMDEYIMGVVSMVKPAMIFTLILFVTFIVTVYLIVRQKKITEMKNDFINNMTHEFKTPISTISIAAQMLSDETVHKSEETYTRLGGVINAETRRLRFQVEKVLQMSLFDHNNISLKLRELDANDLIDNVVQTFSLKVTQSGGTIDTKLEAENPYVNVDEMHFTNIIFNLMDNAVKYRRDDVALHLDVATWNQGNMLCLSVQDNGIGIQKENLKRIFEKFYRVHTGNQHNVKGFGLGLAYVKTMVELHHGTIKATSEIGQGTKFILTLPTINN